VADKECAATHGATVPSLVLFRQFDTSPLVFDGSWEVTPIVDWMLASSVPTLIEFSEDYIEPIFGQKANAIFLFRSEADKDSAFAKTFEEAAKTLKGSILFVVSGITDGIQSRLAEFIGVDAASLPAIKILNPADNMKKFQYQGAVKDITVQAIQSFVDDFKSGNIVPFLKSEEIPEDNTAPVKTVVGKNFHQIVLDNDKDVLIEYYAPWCGHCKKLAPIWDQLADELKDIPNLTIAKMDATANEVEGVDIKGYPTLKWYPKGDKKNAVDFDGERDLDSIKAWLKEHSASYKHHHEHTSEL
jgi:protein disulfide-isomerase A1